MQPTFFPWLGYFDLIDNADHFVFYDDVQFVKQSWQVRNRIKTANGVQYINVLTKKNNLDSNINEIQIEYKKPWKKKLLKTIFYTYQKAPFFNEVYPFLENILKKDFENLAENNLFLVREIANKIGIKTIFHISSELQSLDGTKDARLVDICHELKCKTYLSPYGSSIYIEEHQPGGAFTDHQIELLYQNYQHPKYDQAFGEYISHLSIIDVLFYVGFEKSLELIRAGRAPYFSSQDVIKKEA
ncbi:MAG: WbqC family protein [Flavobacteriales bacterium]|nr:WbqC family protein [Flavobacteriales bacterium]